MAAIIKWGSHAFSTEFLLTIRWGVGFLAFLAVCLFRCRVPPYKTSHFCGYLKEGKNRGEAAQTARFDIRMQYPDPVLGRDYALYGENN